MKKHPERKLILPLVTLWASFIIANRICAAMLVAGKGAGGDDYQMALDKMGLLLPFCGWLILGVAVSIPFWPTLRAHHGELSEQGGSRPQTTSDAQAK